MYHHFWRSKTLVGSLNIRIIDVVLGAKPSRIVHLGALLLHPSAATCLFPERISVLYLNLFFHSSDVSN